jgi:hypothetical protein
MIAAFAFPITLIGTFNEEANEVIVELPSDLREWTLALCLLVTEVATEVRISMRAGTLIIALADFGKSRQRGVVAHTSGTTRLSVSRTELESWQHFFLRAFRDKVPEVDHIDVELKNPDGDSVDLTLLLHKSKPPLTAERAREILLGE